MYTFLLILSITLSYFSFQTLTILKNKLEKHNHLLPPTSHSGLNYDSKVVFYPILAHYVIPTIVLYFLFDGSSMWQIVLFFVIHFALFYIVGARVANVILVALNIPYIRPNGKILMLTLVLTTLSIISLILAYFMFS